MNRFIKDQLVAVLDTEDMHKKHCYELRPVLHNNQVGPASILAWGIHLSSKIGYIHSLDKILSIVHEIDSSIGMFAYLREEGYILLV